MDGKSLVNLTSHTITYNHQRRLFPGIVWPKMAQEAVLEGHLELLVEASEDFHCAVYSPLQATGVARLPDDRNLNILVEPAVARHMIDHQVPWNGAIFSADQDPDFGAVFDARGRLIGTRRMILHAARKKA